MSNMPTFNFQSTGFESQDDVYEAAGFKKSTGKFFEPGVYNLQIVNAALTGVDQFDPSWFQVELVLTDGEKRIKHWLKVPTSNIRYNEGPNNRYPLRQLLELQAFISGLGDELLPTAESLSVIIPKYFADPSVLVEKIIGVEIGFYGNHIKYDDGKYILVDRKGEKLCEETFDKRDEADAEAKSAGIKYQAFAKVLKFLKSEQSSGGWE